MRSLLKLVTVTFAVLGAGLALPLASPAFAAKSRAQRYYQSHHGHAHAGRYASRVQRCSGGRYYTYGGGWGCDYYVYSYDWPLGRR